MSKPEVIGDWLSVCVTHCHRGCLVSNFHFNPQISNNGQWIRIYSTIGMCIACNHILWILDILFQTFRSKVKSLSGTGRGVPATWLFYGKLSVWDWKHKIRFIFEHVCNDTGWFWPFISSMVAVIEEILWAKLQVFKRSHRVTWSDKSDLFPVVVTWILGTAMFWFNSDVIT